MSEQQIFVIADEALNRVVQQIQDDQWVTKIPEWFQVGQAQENLSLRDIINYHASDDIWVPEVLAGKTIAEIGDKYSGDLLGDNPKASFAQIVSTTTMAVKDLLDLDKTVHLSYGDFPAREYLKHITSFRGLRVYDISRLIGIDTTMPNELVQGLWDEITPEIEQWRQWGVFPAPVEVPKDAPLQDRLLGLTGRQP